MEGILLGITVFIIIAISIILIAIASIGMASYDRNQEFKAANQSKYDFMGTVGIGGGLSGLAIAAFLIYNNSKS